MGTWLGGDELMEGSCCGAKLMLVFIGQLLGGGKRVMELGDTRGLASCEGTKRL